MRHLRPPVRTAHVFLGDPAAMADTTEPRFPGLGTVKALNELWRKVLAGFVRGCCNGVGFSGVVDRAELTRFLCFEDWQPELLGHATRIAVRDTRAYGRRVFEESFALFRCDAEVVDRLDAAPFMRWNIGDPDYPADRIFLMADARFVLEAQPYELELSFSNLEAQDIEALDQTERLILEYARTDQPLTVSASVQWVRDGKVT
jgi:hypothetical protein